MKEKLLPIPNLKKKLDVLWSAKVRERDGKCVLCGKTGKGLQAHHYIQAKARSVKYRWDLRNGVTLCYGCHIYTVHMTASYANVSRLVSYALQKEIITPQELQEIATDICEKDLSKDRSFIDACRIELEEK